MAFKGNDSDEQIITEFKLYTGINLAKVVAICPTLTELKDLGFDTDTDPVYKMENDDKGNSRLALDFYLKFDNIERVQKMRLFLTNTVRTSKAGDKQQYVDKHGKTAWDLIDGTCESLKWIDSESVRTALVGEDILTEFLINWLNIAKEDEGRLENPEKLFDLNLSELKGALSSYKDNKVRLLLVVNHADNGKKYQNVYSGYFDRATSTGFNYWEDHINKKENDGYPLKSSYSYELKEYKPETPSSDTDTNTKVNDEPEF